jgi:hypothetical protein
MRKNSFLVGTLAMMLVFGLVVIGCETGDDDSTGDTSAKTIIVEDITGYTGEVCIRVFSDLNDVVNNQPRNAGIGYTQISNGSVSVELTVPSSDGNTISSETKWTGNGSYYIYFMPKGANGYSTVDGMIYVGSGTTAQKYNINKAVITLSYNDFKQYNVWKN